MLTKYYRYWAKTNQSEDADPWCHLVPYHCLDVGAVLWQMFETNSNYIIALCELLGLEPSQMREGLVYLAIMHDVGKYSSGFQSLVLPVNKMIPHRGLDLIGSPLKKSGKGYRYQSYHIRHDAMGFLLLRYVCLKDFTKKQKRQLDKILNAVAGHHGKPVNTSNMLENSKDLDPLYCKDVEAFSDAVMELLGGKDLVLGQLETLTNRKVSGKAIYHLVGLINRCDHLGSMDSYFPYSNHEIPLPDYWQTSLEKAQKAVTKEEGLSKAKPHPNPGFRTLFDFEPTEMQKLADSPDLFGLASGSHFLIVEGPTASGKTETGSTFSQHLFSSGNCHSVITLMPTQATTNGQSSRFLATAARFFGEGGTRRAAIVHGNSKKNKDQALLRDNWYHHKEGLLCSPSFASSNRNSMLSDIGLGTLDQALMGAIYTKFASLRGLGLYKKVLVIDEAHAYDEYTLTLTCALIRVVAALEGHVVLLSATLRTKQRQDLSQAFLEGALGRRTDLKAQWNHDAYPLLTHISVKDGKANMEEYPVSASPRSKRTLEFELVHDTKSALEKIKEFSDNGECVVWIRNTTSSANDVYQTLLAQGYPVELFHSKFTAADRHRIENRVLERFGPKSTASDRKGRILIATQVVEQSLDLCFDRMFTDLCPIDVIMQRAGRNRRHARSVIGNRVEGPDQRPPTKIYVVCPPPKEDSKKDWLNSLLEWTSLVYNLPGGLWRTARLLESKPTLRIPEDVRESMAFVYDKGSTQDLPEDLVPAELASMNERRRLVDMAKKRSICLERFVYSSEHEMWSQDDTPTRMGPAQTKLRLVRDSGKGLDPWESEDYSSGDISVMQSHCIGEVPDSQFDFQEAREAMSDKGKRVTLLVYDTASEMCVTQTQDGKGNPVFWEYSPSGGLLRI